MESRVRPDAGFGTFAVRAPLRLQGDVLNQLRHVGGTADRLLTIQDRDPCSPSFGSFHYAYWRDKTSDFADVRFQEAGAMLGLLSLPAFDCLREAEGCSLQRRPRELAKEQYPEGCYDEWYKGERGFAVTAFTTCPLRCVCAAIRVPSTSRQNEFLIRMGIPRSNAGRTALRWITFAP